MLLDEFVHLAGERISAQTQVVGLDAVFVAQLVAALGDAPVRGAVADDSDLCVLAAGDLGPGDEGSRSLKLAVQTLHIVFKVVSALAVLRPFVVPAPARKISGSRV